MDRVRRQLPREAVPLDLAELFKVFGDSTRMRIIGALLHEELCVCGPVVRRRFFYYIFVQEGGYQQQEERIHKETARYLAYRLL